MTADAEIRGSVARLAVWATARVERSGQSQWPWCVVEVAS